MTEQYELEKWIWTEQDFDQMGWHDSQIYAVSFVPESFEFVIDLDYILCWVNPIPPETYFGFWVSPATLVFENVHSLVFDIESYDCGLEIESLQRHNPKMPINAEFIQRDEEWTWTIGCQQGEISLRSIGYKQYIRSAPVYGRGQALDLATRGGYSFLRGRAD
jgi:hypothetical protein